MPRNRMKWISSRGEGRSELIRHILGGRTRRKSLLPVTRRLRVELEAERVLTEQARQITHGSKDEVEKQTGNDRCGDAPEQTPQLHPKPIEGLEYTRRGKTDDKKGRCDAQRPQAHGLVPA